MPRSLAAGTGRNRPERRGGLRWLSAQSCRRGTLALEDGKQGVGHHADVPELNPVENVWAYLRANRLASSVMGTRDDIVTCCCDAWSYFADGPDRVRSITNRDHAKAVSG